MISDPEIAERLASLDARDKLLRQQMTKQTELSQAQAYVGTCQDMCPERERCLRIGSSLSIFERDEHNQPDEFSMVKEYRRAGADQEEPLPHDLRTPEALERTMNYLCYQIMDDPRSGTQELALHWYDFLWDRLRAIRKDITQQNICDQASSILVERCTRFHIHSCYAMNCVKDFDVDMNKRNLNDCLQMLRQMYTDLRNIGIRCEGELEFQKYDILLHLEEDQLSSNVALKTSEHRSNPDMKYVTQLFYAYTNNYYYKFFKLMEQADYMTSCILSLYVNKVRLNALKIIIAACTSKQPILYPADLIIDSLGFDDIDDLSSFTTSLDIKVQEKNGKFFLLLGKDTISMVRQAGSNLQPLKSVRLVESKKMSLSVGELVYNQLRSEVTIVPSPHVSNNDSSFISNSNDVVQSMDFVEQPVNTMPVSLYDTTCVPKHDMRDEAPLVSFTPPISNQINGFFEPKPTPSHRPKPSTWNPVMHIDEPKIKTQSNDPRVDINAIDNLSPPQDDSRTKIVLVKEDTRRREPSRSPSSTREIIPMKEESESGESSTHISVNSEPPEDDSPEPPEPSRSPLLALAAEAPVCRMRFRQPPRFHPFKPTPEKVEKPRQKRTSLNDSVQSLKDEISDEMKANENLMKIVRMLS